MPSLGYSQVEMSYWTYQHRAQRGHPDQRHAFLGYEGVDGIGKSRNIRASPERACK